VVWRVPYEILLTVKVPSMNLLSNPDLVWTHYKGGEAFDYPIDYSGAVLSARADGHIDLLFRWAPNSYCHFHRHLTTTTSTILAGELHVIDIEDGAEVGRKVRRAGEYAQKEPGDVHMEHGGGEGALVLFNLYAPDGRLSHVLAPDGSVMHTVMLDDVIKNGLT